MAQIDKQDIQLIGGLLLGKVNDRHWKLSDKESTFDYSDKGPKPTFTIISEKPSSQSIQRKEYLYITNPDKSIRWIWPKSLKKPTFLNFYCANSFKSKSYVAAMKLLFALGLQSRISSGSFIVESAGKTVLEKLVEQYSDVDYSLFLGTPGPNRKVILESGADGRSNQFIKIPVGEKALALVRKEAEVLKSIVGKTEENGIPQVIESTEDYLVQSNSAESNPVRPQSFTSPQVNFLKQLYLNSAELTSLVETNFISNAETRINELSEETVRAELKGLWKRLESAGDYIDRKATIPMSLAHGDFTPWNMYETQDGLYVYDWEMSIEKAPLFYDLFHFEFQKGILQDRKSFYEILTSIEKKVTDPIFSRELNLYPVNWRALLKLYIYHISSYYLSVYQSQKILHIQVEWLVEVWEQGLDWSCSFANQKLDRKRMTLNIFRHFNQNNMPYAWLKSRALPVSELSDSSDIDILIEKKDYSSILQWIKMHPACSDIQELRQSFMSTLVLFLNTGETLFIDLLWDFKRKNKLYLDAEKVLSDRILTDENIYISSVQDDLDYCLNFYQQNGSGVPEHYLEYFLKHDMISENEMDSYSQYSVSVKSELLNRSMNLSENKGLSYIKNSVSYLTDIFRRIKGGKGMVISFSGVDGAGKSTVLENTRQLVENRYRRNTIVLRHRPSLLPILSAYKYGKKEAEQRAADTLPRQGTNSSTLSSIVRFIYYYTDYFIGQWVIYAKYVMRGYVVLYDRYYFDFINDPKRANLNLSQTLPLMLSGFIIKPDLNFLLTAPADVILERKQELTKPAIESLTEKYSNYFQGLSDSGQGNFILLENIDLDKTMATIESHFKPVLA